MVRRNNYFRRLTRILIYLLVVFILASGVLVGFARALTPILNQYRDQITQFAANKLQMSVSIETISGSWHWFEPMLKLKNVVISQPNASQPSIKAEELDVGLNLFKSFFHWQIELGTVFIRGSSLTVIQQSDGQWFLPNLNYSTTASSNPKMVVAALFAIDRIAIKEVALQLEPYHSSPITISNLNIHLLSFGKRHFLKAHFSAVHQNKKAVPVELSARFVGDGTDLNKVSTRFHLVVSDIALTDWVSFFPIQDIVISGDIPAFSLEGRTRGFNLTQFNLVFAGKNLHIQNGKMKKPLVIQYVSTNLYATHPDKKKWEFSLKHWQLEHNGVLFPVNKASFDWEFHDKNNFMLKGWIDHLNLKDIAPLWHIHDLQSSPVCHMMLKMRPQGELHQINWSAAHKTGGSFIYSLTTQLNDLSFLPWQKIPGFTHVNGQLHLNQQGGSAVLEGKNTVTIFPLVFRLPLIATDWYSDINWYIQDKGLLLKSTDTHFSTPSGSAKGQLSFFIPFNSDSSVIDLSASVNINQLSKQDIYHYLPTGILTKPVIRWLDDNLESVGKSEASLILKGPLRDFPFDDNKGAFIIRAHINDGKLRLSEGWPTASNLSGNLLFSDRSMDIQINAAEVAGAKITQARAQIPYLGIYKPVILTVTAAGNADANHALAFLHQSPLKVYLKQGLNTVVGTGTVQTKLVLDIPLTNASVIQPNVKGTVVLQNVGLSLPIFTTGVEGLNGNLQFTQNGLSSPGIQGSFLGEPLNIAIIAPSTKNAEQTQIKLNSSLNLNTLQTQYHVPINIFATGKTAVSAEISIAHSGTIGLTAQSLLQGINVNLPLLLQKTSQQVVPLIIKGSVNAASPSQITFTYGQQAAGVAQFSTTPTIKLQSGNLILGSNLLKSPPANGFALTAMMPVCSSVVWKNTLLQLKPLMGQSKVAARSWPAWLNEVTLNCAQLIVSNFSFANATLSLAPLSTGFGVNIQSAEAQGMINIPNHNRKQPLQINFQRLWLTTGKQASSSAFQAVNPTLLPNIIFNIRHFQYNDKIIGDLAGNLHPQSNGALITGTITQSDALNAQLKMQWQTASNMTSLTGSLSSKNTAQALKNVGLPSNLKSSDANTDFSLSWKGAPYQLTSASLNGIVNLSINDGVIDGLGKSTDAKVGFGRILTILSLQNLPDTLRSGFSNVGSSGFSFTKINGVFTIQHGNALIETGSLASRVAGVNLSGSLNLANQTYQMIMTVTPHVTSSVPVAATLVGGPVVGVVAWAASKVLSPALNAITEYKYQVTGTWKNPVITKI